MLKSLGSTMAQAVQRTRERADEGAGAFHLSSRDIELINFKNRKKGAVDADSIKFSNRN